MPVKLTADLVAALVTDVLAWPDRERCGWREIQALALARGVSLTRQALSANAEVKRAWDRKRRCRRREPSEAPAVPETPVAALRREVEALRRTLEECDKRFLRYVHNARIRGVTLSQLEQPIPQLEA